MFRKDCFAILRIDRVWQENLWGISEADARAEGYPSTGAYLAAFAKINRKNIPYAEGEDERFRGLVPNLTIWAIAFHVAFAGNRTQRAAALFAETQGTTLEALRASGNWTGLEAQR